MSAPVRPARGRRAARPIQSVAACLLGALVVCGCTEELTRQSTDLGRWASEEGRTGVISGSPDRDADAFARAERELTEADWKVLEQIAPRPMWERIAELKKEYRERQAEVAGPALTPEPRTEARQPEPLTDVPTTDLPDGKIQMMVPLRYYGGSQVTTAYDAGTTRRKVTLTPADLDHLTETVNQHLGGKGTVTSLPDSNVLCIACDPALKASVLELMRTLDRPREQVEITVRVFEVNQDYDFQQGARMLIAHLSSVDDQSLVSTFSTPAFLDALMTPELGDFAFQGAALRLMKVFTAANLTVDGTFQILADTGIIDIVAAPRMTVDVGETGYILAGQELPIQSARITDSSFQANTTFKPVGVQLYITPRASGRRDVKLAVTAVVSNVAGFRPLPTLTGIEATPLLVNPTLDTREAQTSVTVGDGDTLVLGGLRMTRTIIRERKIPGLGDVPVLGWLFKSHRSQKEVRDLYFFITPKLLP